MLCLTCAPLERPGGIEKIARENRDEVQAWQTWVPREGRRQIVEIWHDLSYPRTEGLLSAWEGVCSGGGAGEVGLGEDKYKGGGVEKTDIAR